MAHHPYYPSDLSLPGYVPMVVDFKYILGVFFTGVAAIMVCTWFYSGNPPTKNFHAPTDLPKGSTAAKYKYLTATERALSCWLMTTGVIHFVIEGWVVVKADFFRDQSGNYLSDTWKEYSKADSRYASRDSFIIGMEAVTAFAWGPLCPLAAWAVMTQRPWRWALTLIVSLGQLYGDVLYYATCYLEGFVHSRPEWLYFWFYFVIINAIWIVIPSSIIFFSFKKISAAVRSAEGFRTVRGGKSKRP